MLRIVIFTLCAGPGVVLAGCGSAATGGHDPAEALLTTTQVKAAPAEARRGGVGPQGAHAAHTWTLEAEYRCPKPEHAAKPTWRQPATAGVACRTCNDRTCLPEMVEMHRREREATAAPGAAETLPAAAAGE